MSSNIAIKAVDISKQYRLGEVGTGTITHDLNRAWARLRGKEDPFLKIGESNDRATKGESDYVWSLKDINFEIEKGDAVGIIGRNGAGKSTLLKLLSRVTKPTTGHFEVQGRIASLLEVGTGFNPEMTGRENIFLNGAILGMRRNEIKRKFDEIVDFAGVERYIDTPVKRYSSGMYVRLAFAVAAHLESEILIVDEVLAVGDAEFQKKCLGKMGDVSKGEGRTVLFVSHNMASVQNLCVNAILLEKGHIICEGRVDTVFARYFEGNINKNEWTGPLQYQGLIIHSTKIFSHENEPKFYTDSPVNVEINIEIVEPLNEVGLGFIIKSKFDDSLVRCFYNDYNDINTLPLGKHVVIFQIPSFIFSAGNYTIEFDISMPKIKKVSNSDCNLNFDFYARSMLGNRYEGDYVKTFGSIVRPNWLFAIKQV